MFLTPATSVDFPAIVALVNLAYRGDENTTSWSTEARDIAGPRLTLDSLAADLAAAPHAHLLTARETPISEILGTVWLDPPTEPASTTWYLGLLTISPVLQNAHRGRELLADAEAFAHMHGATRINITVVNTRDTLIAWYQRRAYAFTGETKPYNTSELTGRPRREGIHFVVMEKSL